MQPQAMYNPGLFCPWQELKMPAKKALSKKRNKVSTSRKKVTAKKPTIKKKAPVKKAAVKKATKKMSKKIFLSRPNATPLTPNKNDHGGKYHH